MMTRSFFAPRVAAGKLPVRAPGPVVVDASGGSKQWVRQAHTKRLTSLSSEEMARFAPLLLPSAFLSHPGKAVEPEFQPIILVENEEARDHLRLLRPFRKLMSYNAENFYQSSKNAHIKSQASIQALADVINQEEPDVIALQEVGDKGLLTQFNLKYLNGRYPNVISKPVWVKSQHQLAFMTKGNIRVVDTKSHWTEFCKLSHGAAVRDFLEATFETESGYRFTVFNAHLKSMRGDELKTAPVRMKEATAAAAILRKRLEAEPDAPLFLTGDLNTHHHSEAGRPVIQTLQRLGQAEGEEALSEVILKDHQCIPTNRSHGYPDAKLDYTFTSKALTPLVRQAYVAGSFEASPWKEASDHLPLVTVFEEGQSQTRRSLDLLSTPPRVEPPGNPGGKKRKWELIA
ncbi:endonuclease/exonuclease/phosphatase family protein [Vampirovibrio chlorellavorus]|uniref:endonuclease/exonuclease/phosphatase family protein n=1 Tax=Vampirovibrio chlorellavorus TaxID=758823 RepID=UPI0026ED690F|nr:endonuclease/exonuclease/phosphatase family protein [Vampirovibrio chlorellavorus]